MAPLSFCISMAPPAAANLTFLKTSLPSSSSTRFVSPLPKSLLIPTVHLSPKPKMSTTVAATSGDSDDLIPRYVLTIWDVLVQSLEREGISTVFLEHCLEKMDSEMVQRIRRSNFFSSPVVPNPIYEANVQFARTQRTGVCIALSDSGSDKLASKLINALADEVPIVCITTGGDMTETKYATKLTYIVRNVNHIPHIVKEAFILARFPRPGPILIHIPKHLHTMVTVPKWADWGWW